MRYVLYFRSDKDSLESIFATDDLSEVIRQFENCYSRLKPFDYVVHQSDMYVRLVRRDIENSVCLLYSDKSGEVVSSVDINDKDYEIVRSVKDRLNDK